MTRVELAKKFQEIFGESTQEIRFFAAPGRVNLIGEHIDYCGGLVFPAALTLGNTVAIRPNGTNTLRFAATDLPGIYEADLNDIDRAKALKWGNYQAGVAKELMLLGCKLVGADLLYDSTLPYGSGLSSSAAIELSTGVALYALSTNKDEVVLDNVQLSLAGQRAESQFCGVNCGIMDQYASGMG
ncbi:MAG: galactokinase, partial [Clostridia bacterium]|nr:galactokinase [Clostridia bacterium]